MKNQVKNGYDKLPLDKLLIKANYMATEMAQKVTTFPAPVPTIGDFKAKIDEVKDAYFEAENRDAVAILARNQKRDELIALMRQLGLYVNFIANGDRAIVLAAGFDATNTPQPRPPVTFVPAPKVRNGANPGGLIISTGKIKGAYSYDYRISTDPNLPLDQWKSNPSKLQKFSFNGLESAKRYHMVLAVLDTTNNLVFSEPTSYVTQ